MKVRTHLLGLVLAICALAQSQPSQEELQYLSSVLPLIQSGQLQDAQNRLNYGLTRFPHSAVLSNALGMVLEQEAKPGDAIAAYKQALEWLPNFTAAQIHLAALYARQGDCPQTKTLLATAGDTITEPGALSAIGLAFAQCEDYRDAATALAKAHALNPASESLTFNLALAQFKSGDSAAALTTIEPLPQDNPEISFLHGKVLQALSKPGAATAMASACRTSPGDNYCTDAAVELIREERFRDAYDLLTSALSAMPPSAASLSALGLAQFSLGRYREAIHSYSKAIGLDPQLDVPREGLAFLLYMTGDLDRARSIVDEQPPSGKDPDFYLFYLRALILYRTARDSWPQALNSLAAALERNARFAPAYFLRGKIRMEQEDLDAALKDFQTASSLDATYALPYYKMEQIYLRENRPEDAQAAQRQFLALGAMREDEVLARQARSRLLSQAH